MRMNYVNQTDSLGYRLSADANGETLQLFLGNTVLGSRVSGIYMIRNIANGKKYIGSSNNIRRRWMEHVTPRNLQRVGKVLARAFRKYGKENFHFTVLECCCVNELSARERFWIARIHPEYNMNDGGEGNLGHTVSPAVRAILSAKARAQWERMTDAERQARIVQNLKGPAKGHVVLRETRMKLRAANLGKKLSPAHRLKMSQSHKRRFQHAKLSVETSGDECNRVGRESESPFQARSNPCG